jgi:choline dehydrogenase-like flavoprotein
VKRRSFLKRSLAGAGILIGGSGVYLGVRSNAKRATPQRALSVLDATSFGVVAAIAERALIFPSAKPIEIAHHVDDSLRYAGPEAQREFRLMLAVVENSLAGVVLRRSGKLFTELTIEERGEALDRWGRSRIALLRGFTNSVRKLCVASHYSQTEAAKEIGHPGPFVDKPDPGAIAANKALSEPRPGLVEGQTVDRDQELSADVCIIGSGAGGAVTASILQRAGKKVIVLDEGGYFTSPRFRMREDECYPQLYQESALRTTKDLAIAIFQGRAIGGTTVVNWTTSFRTPESTLEIWNERFAVGHVDAAALAPHFEAVEEKLSIAEIPFELINRNNRLLWEGCKALGYDVHLLKRNVKGCAHTGFCGYGCPIDAKQSMLVTYLPDALEAGATAVSRARVDRLVIEGGRVSSLEGSFLDAWGLSPTGRKLTVKAKTFVLSSGAIGSPAVLMRSGAPDPHGRLGVRTFLHPTMAVTALYDEPVDGYRGAPQSVASHQFAHRESDIGWFMEVAPVQPLLMATAAPGFGVEHRALMSRIEDMATFIALSIDGHVEGDEGGKVELRDSGWPVLDYPVSDRLWATLRESQRTLAKLHLAAGAKEVSTLHAKTFWIKSEKDLEAIDRAEYAPATVPVFSAHVMGGCGMSDDPKLGVVRSEDLRHHQLDNVHVIDGSVFPTSAGVNPQESIYGLAHLIATRLSLLPS